MSCVVVAFWHCNTVPRVSASARHLQIRRYGMCGDGSAMRNAAIEQCPCIVLVQHSSLEQTAAFQMLESETVNQRLQRQQAMFTGPASRASMRRNSQQSTRSCRGQPVFLSENAAVWMDAERVCVKRSLLHAACQGKPCGICSFSHITLPQGALKGTEDGDEEEEVLTKEEDWVVSCLAVP